MSFFKPAADPERSQPIARLQTLTWVLIYGGLLTLVLGLSLRRIDDETGWLLVAGGGLVAAIGLFLIFIRSRISAKP